MSRRPRGASLPTRSALSRISIDLTASRRAATRSARPALSARPREDRHPNGRRQGVLSDHARLRHDRLGETGRSDTHLYEFRARGVGWGVADPEGFHDGSLPASKTSLLDVIEDTGTKTIHYIYDFGDNWHHVIRVEKIDDALPGADYPRLVRAIGACPPKDVGRTHGYAEFLEAHAETMNLHGGKFEPDDPGIGRIIDSFQRPAKKWAPRPRKPKTTSRRL
ncbi:plasmid pRiA4b ORF-3 family protein [Rhodobacter sphaeroides]|uniref:Arginyl-tRNA:protein arginylyltransferase n=1 Tax=Cereibacter sphaeroides (strain ATCC 17023 / DSM 158 / JCM 6121 / CCUG 31486 / LMG 2827 / NBRC 12203 / NCIMB 8253 / ATH 2.4.1.) TaxID=272943 RepID=Q3IV19_CERS4|nr:putative arginyl-tRNA:protein arginylyltransferase [Cereibacter sphaeroides 2.4.1]AXC64147.1 plasmid pRiA4b ORF-3 family protein [Cereibacter sphaeroides 2.4.1]MVX50340.1 plasmid pRiA4b ORF-3 family protein [Cereibacter sphaeroides]